LIDNGHIVIYIPVVQNNDQQIIINE